MEHECDFLVPAATEKSVHKGNAPNLKCKVVVEGANGPTTFAGEQILEERGIIVAPDLLVNGGGVTCSYFEWLKNLDHISPGRMTKKYEERSQDEMLKIMGFDPAEIEKMGGASEKDIVYSGLEEIMCTAVIENWNYAVRRNLSFRDACLGNAISKVY